MVKIHNATPVILLGIINTYLFIKMPPLKKTMINSNGQVNENEKKNETDSSLAACNICGQTHSTHDCPFLLDLQYIPDTPILSRARQTLPKDLEITKMADGSTSIIAKRDFQKGSTFGPFEAKRNWTMNPMTNFPIRIFGVSPKDTYHLDYSDEDTSNWMCFIPPASCGKEQNLICYQIKTDIFYTAMRKIPAGEELRVWYAPFYSLKMKMPLYNLDFASLSPSLPVQHAKSTLIDSKNEQIEILNKDIAQELAERLPAQKLGAKDDKVNWNCKLCSSIINTVPSYAKHLMEHYKSFLGAFCNLCNRKFYNISVLQKHRAEKHPEADAIGIPTSENHRQQNAQMILLSMSENEGQTEAMKEILEKFKNGRAINELNIKDPEKQDLHLLDTNSINVNDLLQNTGSLIDNSSLKSILENQCLNINLNSITDSILSENMSSDPVKFNVEELASELLEITNDQDNVSQRADNLDCDICGKKFDKTEYLYRHLRKHTGEFICPSCLAVFARKENLVSHVCPNMKKNDTFECPYCQKQFTVKKYLKRHITKHSDNNNCKWCRKLFPSSTELESHKCPAPRHICGQCGKRFVHRAHLSRHMKLHANPKPVVKTIRKRKVEEKPLICEKCGDSFKTPYILKQHLRSHGERTFECDICHRRFHRISVLKQHKQIHQSAQIPCNICGKKLKSKKALDVHVLLHGNKKFQCEKCEKNFFQRCNYLKHYKQVHGEKIMYKCPHCPTQFTNETSFNKHVESHMKPADYSCGQCQKTFHGQYQLKRHIQTSHSGIIYRCPYCKMTARHRHSMRRHFERQHKGLSDEWDRPGFVNQLEEKIAEKEISFGQSGSAEQVLLSVGIDENFTAPPVVQLDAAQGANEQDMLLQVSEEQREIDNTEMPINDVPQLSISDSDTQLAESVLGNAYIFGEDGGDIMFYVLDNGPVITEY